ncbi:hypothetical protein F5Y11DRAFT_163670 [Daldinia sp. FL1419]|nr:hypothetical protein F5Y11DRAFT_163670 [Daldinia sp. FL1419]
MAKTLSKKISNSGGNLCCILNTDNQGWSMPEEAIRPRKFQGQRGRAPKPLITQHQGELKEENFPRRRTKMNLSLPGFDSGLGCFGNPSKLVETGKGELVDLYWADSYEIDAATKLTGEKVFWENEDWIDFQCLFQKYKEPKSEYELILFHEAQTDSGIEPSGPTSRPSSPEADEFLAGLDDMESAFSGAVQDERTMPASTKKEDGSCVRWYEDFGDWIEEAGFVEANLSMPMGTRYYKGSGEPDDPTEESIWD